MTAHHETGAGPGEPLVRLFICLAGATIAMTAASPLRSQQPAPNRGTEIIDVPAGATVDAFFEINLKGNVGLSIRTKEGPACADLWWIIWPLGRIKEIGNICNSADLPIPGWFDFALSSKLRVRGGDKPLRIVVSETSSIANSTTIEWP